MIEDYFVTATADVSAPVTPALPAPEQDLRARLLRRPGICVLTGGQTGVDTAAARAALAAGLPVHLVFPRGFRQEDGPITPARRRALRGAVLHELASGEFAAPDADLRVPGGRGDPDRSRRRRGLPGDAAGGSRPGPAAAHPGGERGPLPGEPGEADDRREPGSGAADPDEIAELDRADPGARADDRGLPGQPARGRTSDCDAAARRADQADR